MLLDGTISSLTFCHARAAELLATQQPAQWAWSSNVNHAVVISDDARKAFSLRWDQPGVVREYPLSGPETAKDLLDGFGEDRPESAKTSINRTINVFRSLRLRLAECGGNDLDAIRALSVLLLWADELRLGNAAGRQASVSLAIAASALRNSGRLGYDPSDFSRPVRPFPIGSLADELLDDQDGYRLDPYLLIRHASGTLFQEAHVELETPHAIQRRLFVTLHKKAPAPTGRKRRDTRYTPTMLARFLSEVAFHRFRRMNPGANRVDILDPACGSGVFLIEATRTCGKVASLQLRGMDTSKASVLIADFAVRQAVRSVTANHISVSVDINEANSLAAHSWGKPDIILMNPPFVSWRVSDDATRTAIRETLGDLYVGQSDTAIALIARAVKELEPGAVLASVVPASFLESRAAQPLRSALVADPTISVHIIGRFRGFEFFLDAAVEPAFVVISRGNRPRGQVSTILAEGGFEDRAIRAARSRHGRRDCIGDGYEVSRRPYTILESKAWTPRPIRGMTLLDQWRSSGMPTVTDVFDVRLGIRTGANRVFLLPQRELLACAASRQEQGYFRPVADTIRNGRVVGGNVLFYPYRNGQLMLTSEAALRRAVPWFYSNRLLPHRAALSQRKSLRDRQWWELSEPRSTWMDSKSPRLLSPSFGQSGSFAYDPEAQYAVVQGNAWFPRASSCDQQLLLAYLALLNSYEFESLLDLLCPRVGGGQYELYQARLNEVPVPDLSEVAVELKRQLVEAGVRITRGLEFDPRRLTEVVSRAYGVTPDIFRLRLPCGSLAALQKRFDLLAAEWKQQRGHSSKIATLVSVPAYQQIIGMGPRAVPLILRELQNRPDHWFTALEQITRQNPVDTNDRGRLSAMTEAWLAWGRDTCNI